MGTKTTFMGTKTTFIGIKTTFMGIKNDFYGLKTTFMRNYPQSPLVIVDNYIFFFFL